MLRSVPEDQGRVDPAEALMREVGAQLREVRLERGENLEEIAEYLRIKPTYLYGIEQGDLSVMPGRTYALGFLRSYADYLGFDGDDLITQIKWTVDNLTGKTRLQIRTPLPESRLPRMPLVVLSLAVLAGIYSGWSYMHRSSDLVVETVAEVPDSLRRMAMETLPATRTPEQAPAGGAVSGTTEGEVSSPPAVDAAGASRAPIATSELPGEPGETPSRRAQLEPSGLAALPAEGGAEPAAGAEVARVPEDVVPAPVPSEEQETAELEILPSTMPLTGADAARNLPAGNSPAREPIKRPTRTALASDLADVARTRSVAPEAGPERAPRSGARPPVRTAALVPAPAAPAADTALPAVESAPADQEQAAEGSSAAAVVATLTGRTSLEEGSGADGSGPRLLEAVNADARVILRANESSWIQISSERGDYLRDRTLEAGDLILVPNRPDLQLWTGNAGGLDVFVDGERLPPLGTVGSVVRDVSLDPESLKARW